jgi:hypothetical protein
MTKGTEGMSVSCKRVGGKWKCTKYPKYYVANGKREIKGTFDKVFINDSIHTSLEENGTLSAGGFGDCRERKHNDMRILDCRDYDNDDTGNKINKAWKEYLKGIPAKDIANDIKSQFSELSEKDEEDFDGEYPNIYAVFSKDKDGNIYVDGMTIDYPSYWQGESRDKLVAVIDISRHTTKKDLMNTDVAEDTQFWDRE